MIYIYSVTVGFAVAFLRQRQSAQNNSQSSSINRNNSSTSDQQPSGSRKPTAGEILSFSTVTKSPIAHETTSRQTAGYSNLAAANRGDAPTITSSLPAEASSSSIRRRNPIENLHDLFPCLHAVNLHMRTKEARLQTFLDNSSIWPAHRIRATPHQIVDAGMYYLGERDRVKCWYCSGGLQNWERDDNPWEEHAKWFPLCEYVLQQKGPDYVHEIVLRFPRLRRPALNNPSTAQAAETLGLLLNSEPNQAENTAPQNEGTRQPMILYPSHKIMEQRRKIAEEMRSSADVAHARTMGFSDDVIENALKR